MVRYEVQMRRRMVEARHLIVEASTPEAARRRAFKMLREEVELTENEDDGGEWSDPVLSRPVIEKVGRVA